MIVFFVSVEKKAAVWDIRSFFFSIEEKSERESNMNGREVKEKGE